jgi:hypothetical protein
MNKTLHTWLKHFGNSTTAASYWIGIDENDFLDLLGYKNIDPKLEETLHDRMRVIPKEDDEIEALKTVIADQDRKLSYAAQAANNFLVSITDHHIKLNTKEK